MVRQFLMWISCVTVIGLAAADHPAANEFVDFNSASKPPSKLKLRQARAKGIELKPEPGTPIRGKLGKPAGEGPFPALVLLHDCRGITAFQDRWAKTFNEWGYVTLQVDSFGPRNLENVCENIRASGNQAARALDALGALAYLETLGDVKAESIGAIGWARGATLSIGFRDGARQLVDRGFGAIVAFYPDCTLITSSAYVDPLLIVSPGNDDWTNPEYCRRIASEGDNVGIIDLPGVLRGFDDPEMGERSVMANFQNIHKVPALGVTFGYDKDAHEAVSQKVRQYLADRLK